MEDTEDTYPTAFTIDEDEAMPPKTTRELLMMRLSQEIREKEGWMEKINDKVILDHWKKEINQGEGLVEYVFDELKYYAGLSSGGIEVGAIDGTWQADGLIDQKLKNDFKKYVHDILENVDESQKDYHPWSNKQVVDLVHPSLFCYVKGVTKVNKLNDELDYTVDEVTQEVASGEGSTYETENLKLPSEETTDKYQWLPSEFHVDSEGTVSMNSYINNLHPEKHSILCSLIVRIFEKFVPLFNLVLTDLQDIRQNRINVDCFNWYKKSEENNATNSSEENESDDSEYLNNREIVWPEVTKFTPPVSKNKRVDLKGRNLQVVVKLSNIELTPKEPKYAGGVWHVEGTESEAIVASGIFYYSSSNITESRLLFRQGIHEPDYEQNDVRGVKEFYGLEDSGPLNQELGSIVCREDRCIAFPNIYQHKVGPFELVDKTKVGHRKILVFFLVDPTKRVLSTKHVAPQQRERQNGVEGDPKLKWTMSLEDARMYREKLMMTRKFDESEVDQYDIEKPHSVYERRFSLCEH